MAPGTPLRHGLDRILRGRTGALLVLGSNKSVEEVTTGGFVINTPFTPTGLRELAKMDGAIILNSECDQILMAGVHLVPAADIDTIETGTRHRTADRVARQTGCPAVTVSASMSTIGLFLG
ncbi:MAG: diadenylate cyclase, partial [Renibacterium salmoninarum]|nr:diadenylate cyclase [Renibacterium salmoninarum]